MLTGQEGVVAGVPAGWENEDTNCLRLFREDHSRLQLSDSLRRATSARAPGWQRQGGVRRD
jgi:hypothetical protein